MKILDNLAINIANRVNAKNDEVMSLTQENERLQRELDASLVAITDREKRIKLCESVIEQSSKEYNKLEKEKESNVTKLQIKTSDFNQLNNEYKRVKNNYDELSKKKLDKESKKQIVELKKINSTQLSYIEILQVIASAKADKTQLKDVFSHNLRVYLDNNFNTMKQAENKLGINRTTLSELKSGKTALSYDNLDILDSKMCEYFECSVYELVNVKLIKEASQ
ncbi:helix-turn-helix transcriptional regulator [Vagococcus fluvialis]|uniref:helix-turn-helix domain-containing protein n=1 Tax=Vagococcus fluvialis TaxID=2738 RepID=UPI00288E2192|nr:helix-turn-helix transcriptional regulator [Vagococcus fluvialis]MDT2782872.1 helix-turn-helix transcriptional regulator [Vagococcus fluvialis]